MLNTAMLMPVEEARTLVYDWLKIGIAPEPVVPPPLSRLPAFVSLALLGDTRDREVAQALLTMFFIYRQNRETDAQVAALPWTEKRFVYLTMVFKTYAYPREVFLALHHRLRVDLPDPRAVSESLLAFLGITREQLGEALAEGPA